MIPDKVREFAKKHGYPCVEYEGVWKEYKVYGPYFPPIDGMIPPTGLPTFILLNGDECRLSTTDEAFACIRDLWPND